MKTHKLEIRSFYILLVCLVLVSASCQSTGSPASQVIENEVVSSETAIENVSSDQDNVATAASSASPTQTATHTPSTILLNPSATISAETAHDLTLLHSLTVDPPRAFSMSFSQDGSLLGSAHDEGETLLWDVSTLQEIDTSVNAKELAYLFSPYDDEMLVVKGAGEKVEVRDLVTGELLYPFEGNLFFGGPAVSKDGTIFATLSLDLRNILLWDISTPKKHRTLYGDWVTTNPHGWPIPDIVFFSPDGSHLAAALTNGETSIIWDLATGERVKEFENERVLAYSHDGSILAARVGRNHIELFDTSTWEHVTTIIDTVPLIESVVFSENGELLIVGANGGSSTIWDWNSGVKLRTISPSGPFVTLSPDGTLLVSYNSQLEEIHFWGVP